MGEDPGPIPDSIGTGWVDDLFEIADLEEQADYDAHASDNIDLEDIEVIRAV